jgi:hypothetical protein
VRASQGHDAGLNPIQQKEGLSPEFYWFGVEAIFEVGNIQCFNQEWLETLTGKM